MRAASTGAASLKTIRLDPNAARLAPTARDASRSALSAIASAHETEPLTRLDDAGLLQLLDGVSEGVILVDRAGFPILANARARALLAARDGVRCDVDGLAGTSPDSTRILRQALAVVGVGTAPVGLPPKRPDDHGHVALPRGGRRLPLLLRLLRLSSGAASARDGSGPQAVVFLRDPQEPPAVTGEVLSGLFGLTRREAELALAVIGGERLERCAATLGMGLGTARQHLKRIYEKTGIHNRAGLCGLIRSCASM